MTATRLWPLLVVATALFAGCGGSEDPAAASGVPAGQTAQQLLGAAGGEVVLASSDGATFTLAVPAGALTTATPISLSTASARSSQHFHLRLAPQGLVLAAGKAATLTIALRADAPLPARGGLLYDGVPVPFIRLGDGRLQVLLTSFGDSADAAAGLGRSGALAARRLAAAAAPACSPGLGAEEGGMTANDAVEIELYGQCMVAAVQALAQTGQYAAAARLASSTAAFLQAAGAGDAAGFVAQASGIACIAYREALSTAEATPVTTMGALYAVLKPILFWEGVRQGFGAACSGVGETDFITVTNAKTSEAAAFYASKKGAITDTGGTEYTEAVKEAQAGQTAVAQVRSLQPSPAVDALLTSAVEQRAQPSLLEAMLQAPWQRCRDSNDYAELARLLGLMDGAQSIKDAIQHCATQVTGQATNGAGAVIATLSPSLGGISAAQHLGTGNLRVERSGRVAIGGTIGTLACPEGDGETLEVSFKGVIVATLPSSGRLLLGPGHLLPELDPAALLLAAGLPANDSGSHPLVLRRKGSACAAMFAITDDVLATVMLDYGLLAVAVSDAYGRCDSTPVLMPAYVRATDLSFPFRLAGSPCAANSFSMTLEPTDGNTVVLANDYVSNYALNPSFLDSAAFINFSVRAARAGTFTLSLNPQWVTAVAGCGVQSGAVVTFVAVSTSSSGAFVNRDACRPGLVGTQATTSFPVAAGEDALFQVSMEDRAHDMTTRGTVLTIHFEPAP